MVGDTTYYEGKVVKKYVDDDGDYCVDIKTSAVNQRGEDAAPGGVREPDHRMMSKAHRAVHAGDDVAAIDRGMAFDEGERLVHHAGPDPGPKTHLQG